MNKKSLIYKIYFGVTLLVLAVAITMRTVACLKDMNYSNGYFDNELLITIADIAIATAVIFAFSYIFAENGDKKFVFNFSSPLNYVFAGTLGVALLFFSRHAFASYKYYKDYVAAGKEFPFENTDAEQLLSYLCLALGIFALLSVAHFILAALIIKEKNTRRADFGLITVIFLSLYATYLYFSNDLPINSPAKIIDQSAYLASSLFFLYETRISIGRERWRAYRAFGLISLSLTAYSAIPSLIVYISNGAVISNSIYETVLTLVLALFIGARLALTTILRENKESSTVSIIKNAFSKRLDEISPKEEKKYAPEDDEDLEGIVLDDCGDYYELNFEEGEAAEKENGENEETLTNENDTGN